MATQKQQVFAFCEKQTKTFTLADVYDNLPHILQPSVRQLLQQARDMGVIHFVDNNGTYVPVQ